MLVSLIQNPDSAPESIPIKTVRSNGGRQRRKCLGSNKRVSRQKNTSINKKNNPTNKIGKKTQNRNFKTPSSQIQNLLPIQPLPSLHCSPNQPHHRVFKMGTPFLGFFFTFRVPPTTVEEHPLGRFERDHFIGITFPNTIRGASFYPRMGKIW